MDNSFNTKPVRIFAVNVQVTNVSATRKSLVVTLDPSEVDAEHQASVGEVAKFARLPGFRPGKVPAAMIAKRFSKEIAEDFKQKVVAKAYRTAMEQEKLDVLNVVKVEEGAIAAGSPANVTITLDVRPDFALPDYSNMETKITSTDATDAEVEKVIEGVRAERADFKPAERAAQKGDYVKLAYEGKIDGQAITDLAPDKQLYGKVPQTWEEVEGANEGVIPGLGQQLAGLKSGDKKDVTVTFPAEFAPVPALAGKQAVYAVEIQEIRERVLPALDAEFFAAQKVDDLAGLQGGTELMHAAAVVLARGVDDGEAGQGAAQRQAHPHRPAAHQRRPPAITSPDISCSTRQRPSTVCSDQVYRFNRFGYPG